MAAAWFNALVDPTKAHGLSAGTQPGTRVYPDVVAVMREAGVELDGATPRLLTDELAAGVDGLVTMGCGESCPVVPGVPRMDWPLEDPSGKSIERVRAIRDDVRARVVQLVADNRWERQAP
jgi:arsenate reductase